MEQLINLSQACLTDKIFMGRKLSRKKEIKNIAVFSKNKAKAFKF
tara:strand:+ start:232 stop:366 length:135 start_codon:yes stop_codon:yes gene_type:complete